MAVQSGGAFPYNFCAAGFLSKLHIGCVHLHDLRYAPSWRCGNGFNECHEIDRRLDGAIRNCLGDFTDQVLQSVAGVLDAVGVNGGEAEATARNILARSQPLFTFADESNTRLMQAGAEVYGLGRVKSLLRGETCGSGKGAKTAG